MTQHLRLKPAKRNARKPNFKEMLLDDTGKKQKIGKPADFEAKQRAILRDDLIEAADQNEVNGYIKIKDFYALIGMARNNGYSENVRKAAGMEAITILVTDKNMILLNRISEDEKMLDHIRKTAANFIEVIRINTIKRCGREKKHEELYDMCKNTNLSENIRKIAGKTLISVIIKNWEDGSEKLIWLSKDKTVSDSLREAAGMKAIKEFDKNKAYRKLLSLSRDDDLPEKVKKAAGMKAIKEFTKNESCTELMEISSSNDNAHFPEKVKKTAGINAVKIWVEMKNYQKLIDIFNNNALPESVRKAMIKLIKSVSKDMAETLSKDKDFEALIKLCEDKTLPDIIRERIGIKMIEKIASDIDVDYVNKLMRLSKNDNLLDNTRKLANITMIRIVITEAIIPETVKTNILKTVEAFQQEFDKKE